MRSPTTRSTSWSFTLGEANFGVAGRSRRGLELEALKRFGIPVDWASQYVLATAPGNPQAILDDSKTVTQVGLHKDSRVYLEKPHTDA